VAAFVEHLYALGSGVSEGTMALLHAVKQTETTPAELVAS
jgi:hypothetical protein